ncbi:MATERNAL EFFECT EMBRYO ARREST 46, EMBRYO SAC DEVELOPMENT ARREST 8 [Hibiscus trionum]|uniref:MATERNAL EFFECT EMBRYO ARREST 46, EMBRYO SAC DEVELOPMENT ARREST 8 n=1 Tax=Hibiscus trionum TaxID=183268 RepID=A0A9W7ME91_HIBTR|nr:MATERNAL EFFECT EMBRYO ARREST 46, EMBRYO SAC DEVELOPMENT ARREST 8 [Hibiscus trionum]
MRIRKNAKLSSVVNSTGAGAETVHVCELNQSPWDVIPFAHEPYPSYLHHQFEPEDSFNGNGSLGDSVGAVESVASMMDSADKPIMKAEGMVIDDDDEMKTADQFGFRTQCEDQVKGSKQDCSLKSRRHDNGNNPSSNAGNRRGRARAAKKGSAAASNPYEFYYYSGFGPSWGRRRGGEMRKNMIIEGKDVENNSSAVSTQNNNTTPSSSSQFDNNEGFDYVDDEDDDDEEEEEENVSSGGKKRMRKPIKARSLKSLM